MKKPWHSQTNIRFEACDHTPTYALTPKDRILRRIRRLRRAETPQVPSIAETAVRMAAILMVVALCLRALHR